MEAENPVLDLVQNQDQSLDRGHGQNLDRSLVLGLVLNPDRGLAQNPGLDPNLILNLGLPLQSNPVAINLGLDLILLLVQNRVVQSRSLDLGLNQLPDRGPAPNLLPGLDQNLVLDLDLQVQPTNLVLDLDLEVQPTNLVLDLDLEVQPTNLVLDLDLEVRPTNLDPSPAP